MSAPRIPIVFQPVPKIYPVPVGIGNTGDGDGEVIPLVSRAGAGLAPALPSSGLSVKVYLSGHESVVWTQVAYSDLAGVPLTFNPTHHGSSHVSGPDAISLATTTAPGLLPPLSGDATTYFTGTAGWVTPPTAPATPIATVGTAGLMRALSGSPGDVFRGDGTWLPEPAAVTGLPHLTDATQVLLGTGAFGKLTYSSLNGIPLTFIPSTHGVSHSIGGTDPIPLLSVTSSGLAPALPATGGTTKWFRGDGSYIGIPGVTTAAPGLTPTLPGVTNKYFRADGNYTVFTSSDVISALGFTPSSLAVPALVAPGSGAGQQTQVYLRGDDTWQPVPVQPMSYTADVGDIVEYSGTGAIPAGWGACDGSAISRTTYAALFAQVGTTYGVGDGSSTFNIPGPTSVPVLANDTRLMPTGSVIQFSVATAPAGWLNCDGASYPTATYPALFAVLAYTYGGSGANFNVPDARGRSTIGIGTGSGLTARTLAATGGEESHQLSSAEMPSHTHTQNPHSHIYRLISGAGSTFNVTSGTILFNDSASTGSTTATNQNTGGDGVHNNLQPFLVLNFIIKT